MQLPDFALVEFDWDPGNRDKCEAHGLTREEVERLFRGSVLVLDDPAHSMVERRFQAIGRTADGRFAFIVFTLRECDGRTLVRPVSARYMHRKEIARHERQAPAHPDH